MPIGSPEEHSISPRRYQCLLGLCLIYCFLGLKIAAIRFGTEFLVMGRKNYSDSEDDLLEIQPLIRGNFN